MLYLFHSYYKSKISKANQICAKGLHNDLPAELFYTLTTGTASASWLQQHFHRQAMQEG